MVNSNTWNPIKGNEIWLENEQVFKLTPASSEALAEDC